MPAKTDRICPGLESSPNDDAIRNFYQASGSTKPLTLAPIPEPERSWAVLSMLPSVILATDFLLLGVVIAFATTLPPAPELFFAAYAHASTTTPTVEDTST
eukprot:2774786-Pleurochrysis_carterae.AAC.1